MLSFKTTKFSLQFAVWLERTLTPALVPATKITRDESCRTFMPAWVLAHALVFLKANRTLTTKPFHNAFIFFFVAYTWRVDLLGPPVLGACPASMIQGSRYQDE